MSAALVITRDRVQMEKAEITGTPFVIGRSNQCALVLPDNMLSREHCVIDWNGHAYVVADKGSRNGTRLNGELITEATPLRDGDKLSLGPFDILFYTAGENVVLESADFEEDAVTRFAGAEDVVTLTKKTEKEAEAEPVLETPIASASVRILTGPVQGTVEHNWKGDLRFGRGADNSIVIPDDALSSHHARIFRDPSGRNCIEDLDSANGTFVNNVRIRERRRLNNRDRIRIGTTLIVYTEVDPSKARSLKIRTAAVAVLVVLVGALFLVFQPEDEAAKYVAQGDALLQEGKHAEAVAAYNQAVEADQGNKTALQKLSRAKSMLEAEALLAQAKTAALEERYQDALDIGHRVRRLFPNNQEARDLVTVVMKVEEAQVAMEASNWSDALRLIKQALQTYPDSEVLLSGLRRAEAEQQAEEALAEAKRLLESREHAAARESIGTIPSGSASYPEAMKTLEKINNLSRAEAARTAASVAYEEGQVDRAMQLLSEGLSIVPDDADLLSLKRDIEQVSPLLAQLEGSQALLDSTNIDAIQKMVANAESVMQVRIRSEEVGRVRKRAGTIAEELRARLRSISETEYRQGNQALSAKKEAQALRHFTVAAKADPGNQSAVDAMTFLRRKLEPEIELHYRQGKVHEDLGQTDLAIAEYRKVIELAVPDDGYYQRAMSNLKRLER